MNLSSGEVSTLPAGRIPKTLTLEPTNLPATAFVTGVPGVQFLSADSHYVLGVEPVARDPEWERYRWAIHERASAKRAAELRMHWSYAPFLVLGSRLIYQTPAYMRRADDRLVEESKKLRAADLASGRELWAWPIRDTAYRGPIPH